MAFFAQEKLSQIEKHTFYETQGAEHRENSFNSRFPIKGNLLRTKKPYAILI